LRGEELSIPEKMSGYVGVCVDGLTVGFGKAVNGRLKNKYPKGLRLLR
jgi:NOL1/NOP2/fmu family ribosome biogenesis protein